MPRDINRLSRDQKTRLFDAVLAALASTADKTHATRIASDVLRRFEADGPIEAPSCHAPVPDMGQSVCTLPFGHDGPHRCAAVDVDAARNADRIDGFDRDDLGESLDR